MTATYTDADFEALQNRVDSLCNLLCDLATATPASTWISRDCVKTALQSAGILDKEEESKYGEPSSEDSHFPEREETDRGN